MASVCKELQFKVVIEQDEDGGFIGKVSELRGCLSQGDTLDELMKNIKEAIQLYLEVMGEEKPIISGKSTITYLEIGNFLKQKRQKLPAPAPISKKLRLF